VENQNSYPIHQIRAEFPALNRQVNGITQIYLDGPSGTQVVRGCIQAMVNYMENGSANLGGKYQTSIESMDVIDDARQALGDFVGVSKDEIAIGPNMTSLTYMVSRALSQSWQAGDEIVVTELDHRANVDPWIQAANDKNCTINWIKMDSEKLILDLSNLDEVITPKTKVVCIGHASNGVGTINDISTIADAAKKVGAILVVDAVHSAPHLYIDFNQLKADILLASLYKFFGPHLGFVAIKKEIFDELKPYKLTTSPTTTPEKLETGTQNHEAIAGIVPAVDFFTNLGKGNTRREKIKSAFELIEKYEDTLAEKIRVELSQLPHVQLYQADKTVRKTPTIAFRVKNISPSQVCSFLAEKYGICSGDGHFYAKTIGDRLDLNKDGGWVRIGLAPYNTEEEVEIFLNAMKNILVESK